MHGLHFFNVSFGYMVYLGEVTLYPVAGGHYLKPGDFELELSCTWCLHSAGLEQRF